MSKKSKRYRARLGDFTNGNVVYRATTDRRHLFFKQRYARSDALRITIPEVLEIVLGRPGATTEFVIGDAKCQGGISGDGVWFLHPEHGRCVVPFRIIAEIYYGQTFLSTKA